VKGVFKYLTEFWASGKYLLLFNIIERLTFFAFYVSIARYVDQSIYGFIVTVFSFTNIIATIFDLGIPFYIQRESATNENIKPILVNSIFIKLISILIFLPLPFLYFYSNLNNWVIILLVSIINFFAPVNQILIYYLNGKYLFKDNYRAILIARIPYIIFLVIATILKINLHLSLLFILLSLVIQNFILLKKSQLHYIHLLKIEINFRLILNVIKKSFPFGLGVIFIMIYDRFDVLLIQKFISDEAVAIYSAAYSLFRNSSILSGIIMIRVYNDFSKYYVVNHKIDFKIFLNSLKVLLFLSLILILIFNFLGEIIISLFYTSRFIHSARVLGAVSFALPFLFLNNLTGVTLNSIHKENLTMFSTLIGMIVNVSLNFLLIPRFGIFGGVISTIATENLIFVIQLIFNMILMKEDKN
jgi:O-antigen/teichoic acid export membrane protein